MEMRPTCGRAPRPALVLLALLIPSALSASAGNAAAGLTRSLPAALSGAVAQHVGAAHDLGRRRDLNRVLVRLREGLDAGASLPVGSRPLFGRWHSVPVPEGDLAAALVSWSRRPEVETVELSYLARIPEGRGVTLGF